MLITIILSIFPCLILAAALFTCQRSEDYLKDIDTKEHRLFFIYPLANQIIIRTGIEKLLNRNKRNVHAIKALYSTSRPEQLQRLLWCSKVSLVILIIMIFDILTLFNRLLNSNKSDIMEGNYLQRPGYGEGGRETELKVTLQKKAGNSSDQEQTIQSKDVKITIKEQQYTKQELELAFKKAIKYLEKEILGKNTSANNIKGNLNFCSSIPGTAINVKWRPENYDLIRSDGIVRNESVKDEGTLTKVTVVLTYDKQQLEHVMTFRVMPKVYSEEEILSNQLKQKIINFSDKTAQSRLLQLPDTLGDYHLTWHSGEKDNGLTLMLLGFLMAIAAWILSDKELENRMKKRKEQMLLDYPELINKFTLLVNAGMTIKQAWIKIAEDYSMKSGQSKSTRRYAYEEMLITVNELKLGQPENQVYEQYGRRIGLICYIKFSSLISQNLKKGTKGFTELLMREAMEAFEERKEIAKRLGEEAGTKLLIPMMLMLIMVFLIIMIPAFWAFRI